MSVLSAGEAFMLASGEDADYQISKSLRFNSADSAYLSRTPASAGNRKTWTWSGWVKRSALGATQGRIFGGGTSDYFDLYFPSGDELRVLWTGNNLTTTTAVFRDPSAWYHIVLAVDTTQSTANDRIKIYVNGTLKARSATNPSQNYDTAVNNNVEQHLGRYAGGTSSSYFDGYLADVHFIDGQALAPSDFGEFNSDNIWQAKKYTFSTNPNNGTTWSSGTVTGTLYSGSSWANAFDGSLPSSLSTSNSAMSYSSTGDITLTFPTPISGTIRVYASGAAGSSTGTDSKIVLSDSSEITCNVLSSAPQFFSFGSKTNITSITLKQAQYGVRLGGIELNGYVLIDGADDNSFKLDFNSTTTNQALGYDASVDSPARNNKGGFDAITYSGTGSNQTIKGLAFQPDLLWLKRRNGANAHVLFDSIRGVTKALESSNNGAEKTNDPAIGSFNSNGFTVTGSSNQTNASSGTYVAWAWKAGGTAGTNTDGSITSQVSTSSEYGFSVISYTGNGTAGATVGHGLSSAPSLILLKTRGDTQNWMVYHSALGATKAVFLSTTDSVATSSVYFNNTAPTSSVFSLGTRDGINKSSDPMTAYCWSEVSGFSKFGSYSGNGSSTGPTITIGFKPRFILIKASSINGEDWVIIDTTRSPSNPSQNLISPNLSDQEYTHGSAYDVDILSDGFQIKNTNARFNSSGATYIYAAFGDRAGNDWTTNNLIATAGLETASQGMDVVNYSGNGSTQSISSLAFQPDLVWIKARNQTDGHNLFDIVRGTTKVIKSNNGNAELTESNSLTAFNSDGFTVGSNASNAQVNASGFTYVAWCWKAGGTASSNSDGSITSSVSANQTYGFSVVKNTYSGSYGLRSVGHGLGKTPSLVISKRTDSTGNWLVHTRVTGSYQMLTLNAQSAATAASSYFSADNSTFSLYHGHYTDNGYEYIHYCWSEIPGFSKISTFTGTGSSGNKVTTGFKPKFVLIKRVGNASDGNTAYGGWGMYQEGETDKQLMAHCSGEEGVRGNCAAGSSVQDIQANVVFNNDGFTLSSAWYEQNDTGVTYIYAAWADKPPSEIIDSLIDTPTDIEAGSGNNPGNYITLNPLHSGSNVTLSNGNLQFSISGTSTQAARKTRGTIAMPASGKYYWETTVTTVGELNIGVINNANDNLTVYYRYNASNFQNIYIDGSNNNRVDSYTDGDVIGTAYDADNQTIRWYKNGVAVGSVYSLTNNGQLFPLVEHGSSAGSASGFINFGATPFQVSPPTGYKSLCTTNLPEPTISDPSTAFATKLYTGNGGTQTITGLNFSPDFTWIKNRNSTDPHILTDIVRGAGKFLQAQASTAETDNSDTATAFSAFTSDGFTVGNNANWSTNTNSSPFVSWNWDAGSSNTSISAGSLNSSVYDRSKAWSSLVTTSSLHSSYNSYGPNSKFGCFDGKGNTSMYSASGPLTITFDAQAFPASGGPYFVEVQTNQRGIKVNGQPSSGYTTDIASGQATYWANNGSVSSLTSIEINQASNAYGGMTNQIRVNGKILADSINNNVTWSNSLSGLSGSSLTNPPNGFDGDESSYADSTAGFTLDLSGHTFGTGTHTIEVKSGGATSFSVNGSTSLTDPGGGGAKVWTGTHTGELTSLASSATGASVYYIKIDGEYLLDPGQDFVDDFPSIASTVRANPSAGFSIVTWTGQSSGSATIGHGLNAAPEFIILKGRTGSVGWTVGHESIGWTKRIQLNTTAGQSASSNYWNNTAPTSSLFTSGANNVNNTFVAYCISPVSGYSAVGSYTGNGSTDGPFIYTGFKPAFLIIKNTTSGVAEYWLMMDSARSPDNVVNEFLYPNGSGAEGTQYFETDFLSNGFKIRNSSRADNYNNESYIYIAFASHPFRTSRAT